MWMRFFVYGLLGWGLEICWTGLGSILRRDWRLVGRTYLWMFPIYGLAAPLFEPLHLHIEPFSWPVRGLIWVAAIFALEFVSGWLLRIATGGCPWDYSRARASVLGLIRLDYAPVWFVVGLMFEVVHHRLTAITPLLQAALAQAP